ncbi:MAG: peptide ABC transporter substrate-binding protein [Candidatus Jorgensenbacteria bacterium]
MLHALSPRERTLAIAAGVVFVLAGASQIALAIQTHSAWIPVAAGSYREGVVGQPIALNPILSANPADQDISTLIYSRLTDLATTIETDAEFRTYTVKLAEDLTWDDGVPLTSDDVVFTVKMVQDPDVRSPFAMSWRGVVAERVSELQVTFTLPSPFSFFRESLARLPVIPQHIYGAVPPANLHLSSYNLEPVGSGPYRVKGYEERRDGFITEYRLVPNERYRGTPPFIQDFYFLFFSTNEELQDAFRLRRVDGFGLSLPPASGVPVLAAAVTERIPMTRYYAIFMNQLTKPSLKDDNFRLALLESIDRDRIVREAFGGEGTLVNSPWLAGGGMPSYDPAGARDHLVAAKVDSKDIILAVPQIPALQKAAELIKGDWDAVGIAPVSIVTAPPGDFVDTVVRGRNYELLLFGNTLEHSEDLYPFWHSSERLAPGLNLSLYQNAEVDRLLETNRQTGEEKKRGANLERITTLLVKDNPALFLFTLPYLYIHRDNLQGFPARATDTAQSGGHPQTLVIPSDRLRDAAKWSVAQVRVLQ